MSTITELIQKAISESGMSRYALSKKTGIAQSTLSRFMSGERGMSMLAIGALLEALDLEIRPKRKGAK
jgi:transcriptional regulator with XRE-family HTH domain